MSKEPAILFIAFGVKIKAKALVLKREKFDISCKKRGKYRIFLVDLCLLCFLRSKYRNLEEFIPKEEVHPLQASEIAEPLHSLKIPPVYTGGILYLSKIIFFFLIPGTPLDLQPLASIKH